MQNSADYELRALYVLASRCDDLIQSTSAAIAYTRERVRRGSESIERERARGFGCDRIIVGRNQVFPTLVDAQVFDDSESAAQLNEITDSCSCCGSKRKALVALVRFESLGVDMALCAECYRDLSERALGQVV